MTFKNKHIVITGANGGIAQAIAFYLLERGATLTLLDLDVKNLSSIFEGHSSRIRIHCADVTDRHSLDSIINELSVIDGLVHAAAILKAGSLIDMGPEIFASMVQVNLLGCFNVIQSAARRMSEQKKGAVVVIGSNSSSTPRRAIGGYGATKSAVHMLTKNFALELAEVGVRCNVVSPGSTRTSMLEQTWTEQYGERETIQGDLASYRLGIPLQKLAEPEDIAKSVAFLLSDDSGHITMHDLRVDGGATLGQM